MGSMYLLLAQNFVLTISFANLVDFTRGAGNSKRVRYGPSRFRCQRGIAMVQAEDSVVNANDESTVAGVLRGDVFVPMDELMARGRRAATGLQSLGVESGGSV